MEPTVDYSLNTLRINKEVVALEAGLLSNVADLLRNIFPTISKEFTGLVGKFSTPEKVVKLTSSQKAFLKELEQHTYLNIAPLAAYVPEGMDVTYLSFLDVLKDATEHCEHLLDVTMVDYCKFLGNLINNADAKLDSSSLVPIYKNLQVNREELNKRFLECFKHGSSRTEVSIGNVVSRNSDWPKIFELTEDVNREIEMVDREKLSKKILECVQLINVIQNKIKRNEFEGISPEAVNTLADGAFQIASELEFYSVIHYRVIAITTAINRTIEHFQEVFKK